MTARRIGLVGYEGVNALDLTGPHEVFCSSAASSGAGERAYEVICLSPDGNAFRSSSGLLFGADCSLADAPAFDTIVIPAERASGRRRCWSRSPTGCGGARRPPGGWSRSARASTRSAPAA